MSTPRRPATRFYLVFLLVSLVVAAGVSWFASSHPDGLEYVAEETGFLDTAEESPASASPLSDYSTRGVENDWASGAVAGVAGVGLTLVLGGALFWSLRRRGEDDAAAEDAAAEDQQHLAAGR